LHLNENPRSILEKKRGKKVKKRQEKTKKSTKSGKIEKKAKKCPVLLCKFVQNVTPDTNASFNVKIGKILRGKISLSK